MPRLSRSAVTLSLALFATLLLALPAVAEEAPAAGAPAQAALEAPVCEAAPELPSLEVELQEPQAASCTTCPAEPHACTYDFECDAYCSGCSGNCVVSRSSVCPWIEITFPRVCQCI